MPRKQKIDMEKGDGVSQHDLSRMRMLNHA